jgi:hypothetical protein
MESPAPGHSTMASLESLESRAIVLLFLVFLAKSVAAHLHKRGVHWVSETAVYMFTGLISATLLHWFSGGGDATEHERGQFFRMSSRFFYLALLPPIVFEVRGLVFGSEHRSSFTSLAQGGYSLQRLLFFNNFALIFSLAYIGGLFSTVVTSLVIFFLGRTIFPELSIPSCLVFGSLISSTDPVTVLASLPENLDKRVCETANWSSIS